MVLTAINRLKYSIYTSPSLDNFVFKLCYRWTVLCLVVFSFVITCRLLFGYSFSCIKNSNIPSDYMHVKCYEDTPYTLPGKLVVEKAGSPPTASPIEDVRRHQYYYPWVNLLFLVHAFNFYLPHLLWKSYESGYLYRLTAGVQKFFDKEEKRGLELCYLAKYVLITQGKHKLYTGLYIFFEACNYCIALGQTLWLIHFFNVTGIPEFLSYQLETWSDFRNFYFPSTGACEVRTIGASGVTIKVSTFCEMPLNVLYMKMFLFLHVWYIALTILCALVLIYRIAILVPSFRVFAAKASTPLAERPVLKSLCQRMSYSDWFFLTRLRKSMTDIDFAQMLDKIAVISQGKDPQNDEDRSYVHEDGMKDSSM